MLWWGRFDPDYSRNRVLRKLFAGMGWEIIDFKPRISAFADWEIRLRSQPKIDLVWVPCFRQRDMGPASRFAERHGLPLIFDPLISSYDKQVDERGKLPAESWRARELLDWERRLFRHATLVVADTPAHASYFADQFGLPAERTEVVYVGAEEALFFPADQEGAESGGRIEVLFYGSFIPLQGPRTIIEAARLYEGPPVTWTLIGKGPLRAVCETMATGMGNVRFEDWLPYQKVPARIRQAHILLGVFGATPKAGRVIPNKVYQAMACGKVVVTRSAEAYPADLAHHDDTGLVWCDAADARSLAASVRKLAEDASLRERLSHAAAATFRQYFSEAAVNGQLQRVLNKVMASKEMRQ